MIANGLNRDRILCPSAHDPQRNTHRSGAAWVGSAVEAILRNPRYTGYEVWNKQHKDEVLIDVEDVALGHETKLRWNPESAWIFSPKAVHEPVIDREIFDQVRSLMAAKQPKAPRGPRKTDRTYLLRGLLFHSSCGRSMEGSWNNGHAHYRCKLKAPDQALAAAGHPRTVYLREDKIVERLDAWLGRLFEPERRDETIDALHRAGQDPLEEARRQQITAKLRTCDDKLATYRAALEGGVDLETVSAWISEVRAERTRYEIDLARLGGQTRLSREQIASLVAQMSDLATLLHQADPRDRAEVYARLNLRLTYHKDTNRVMVESRPDPACTKLGVRGGT